MNQIKGILIDTVQNETRVETINSELETFYRLLHCQTIDITTRKIGDDYFSIVCDDEGLLCNSPIVSAVSADGSPSLVGSLFVAGLPDEDGNLTSITEKQRIEIFRNIVQYIRSNTVRDALLLNE